MMDNSDAIRSPIMDGLLVRPVRFMQLIHIAEVLVLLLFFTFACWRSGCELQSAAEAGQPPASSRRQIPSVWDGALAVPHSWVRAGAALFALAGPVATSGFVLSAAINAATWQESMFNGFVSVLLLPLIYLLLIFALLGRAWRKAWPHWLW